MPEGWLLHQSYGGRSVMKNGLITSRGNTLAPSNRAAKELFERNQPTAAVEMQATEDFVVAVAKLDSKVFVG